MNRPRLLLLGTGFGAFGLLRSINRRSCDVTVVSPRNDFLFTPFLPSMTVGTIEFRSIVGPVRSVYRGIRFHQARCTGIDFQARVAHCVGAS